MADIATVYTLTTPSYTVLINDPAQSSSGLDQIYADEVTGLGGAPLTVPLDDMPYGHGGLIHASWKRPRHITFGGIFLIVSTFVQNNILAIRNDLEEDLRVALDDIIAPSSGTLDWTPYGQSQRTLEVYREVELECPPDQNFLVRAFHFGLVAPDPDWVEST